MDLQSSRDLYRQWECRGCWSASDTEPTWKRMEGRHLTHLGLFVRGRWTSTRIQPWKNLMTYSTVAVLFPFCRTEQPTEREAFRTCSQLLLSCCLLHLKQVLCEATRPSEASQPSSAVAPDHRSTGCYWERCLMIPHSCRLQFWGQNLPQLWRGKWSHTFLVDCTKMGKKKHQISGWRSMIPLAFFKCHTSLKT